MKLERFIRSACERVSRGRNARHIPREGDGAYLSRYYLVPDRDPVFDEDGHERADKPAPGLSLYLHHFHRSDADDELHNHPWRWSLSFVLAGGYIEERRGSDGAVRARVIRRFRFNLIRANDFHRVDLIDAKHGAWTLFLTGPRTQSWGFWCRYTGAFTPWREFVTRKGSESA